MRLKSKSKNPCILSVVILLLIIVICSCKKEISKNFDISSPKILSKDAPDLAIRLAAIKEKFYADKLEKKLIPNIDQKLSWTPDWDHPKVQTVNDSVSYVFYRLIGKVKINDKIQEVTEKGAASFLMVKDEGEFFKALYYHPQMPNEKSKVKTKINMQNFSGKLLLNNLHNGENFLIDYTKGKLSESYQKKQLLTLNKLAINNPATKSYWIQQCRTEYRACTFVSDGYSYCGGGIDVIYSEYCNWPSSVCGVTYYLTDSDERLICEDIWFPDPPEPTDPEEVDDGSNNAGSNTIPSDPYLPGQDHEAIDPKKYTKCFDNIPDAGATYKVIVQVLEPVPGTSLNYGFVNGVGHTAITLIKQGSNGFKVTQTVGFYPTTNPFSSASKMVNNSDQTDYTIRMIFDMGSNTTDFKKILAGVENPPSQYDLLEMNCTAFVVGICSSGGISLPNAFTTVGVAGAGGVTTAMTPGGLGHSMRNAHAQGDNRVSSGPTSVSNNPASNGPCN